MLSFYVIFVVVFVVLVESLIIPFDNTAPLCPWTKDHHDEDSLVELLEWKDGDGDQDAVGSGKEKQVLPLLDNDLAAIELFFNNTTSPPTPPPQDSKIHHLKEAGVTCRERTNYASLDCAASVVSHNPGTSGASSILVESKDSYMLNKCSLDKKFVVIELCDDILIDTVALANYEYFSSTFKTFRVSASDRYPPSNNEWKLLGTYQAKNTRSIQAFPIESPLIWARFVKFDFLSFWDNEFYCPLSVIRVHGTTMMEEYKKDEDKHTRDNQLQVDNMVNDGPQEEQLNTPDTIQAATTSTTHNDNGITTTNSSTGTPDTITTACTTTTETTTTAAAITSNTTTHASTPSLWPLALQPLIGNFNLSYSPNTANVVIVRDESLYLPLGQPCRVGYYQHSTAAIEFASSFAGLAPIAISTWTRSTATTKNPFSPSSSLSSTTITSGLNPPLSFPSPAPTTQDSIYKTIMKRLSLLESNATISKLYLEEQTQALRQAFNHLQKRNSERIDKILNLVNSTLAQRSTALDNIVTGVQTDVDMRYHAINTQYGHLISKLQSLDDEVHFQRRVFIVQSLLLIIMMVFVMLTRGPFLFDIEGTSFGSSNLFRQQRLLKSALALEEHAARLRMERRSPTTTTTTNNDNNNNSDYPDNDDTNSSSSTLGSPSPLSPPLENAKIGPDD